MDCNLQALPAGTVIAGFRIERVLGVGGFGITYEAASPINRRFAIKEFFPYGVASRQGARRLAYAADDPNVIDWALDRFERSTVELSQLRHPSIVEVFHYVKENNTGYMIMEYVEGVTLEGWLAGRGAPSPAELRSLIEPVLDALAYVHDVDRIHRDVAPDNIMIRPDGRPVLIDFGAIKAIERRTSSATGLSYRVAKASYSPPEQTEAGAGLDPSADIYALGAVLYRALAGVPPVDANKRKDGLLFEGADPYAPLAASRARKHPPAFCAAIDRALAFHAKDRPRSIEELREGLGWTGDPVGPRMARSGRVSGGTARRAGFAVLAVVVLMAVGAAALPLKQWIAGLTAPAAVEVSAIAPGPAPDEVFWQSIKDSGAPTGFEEFLRRFPSSSHAAAARTRLEELRGTAEQNRIKQATAAYERGDEHYEKGEYDLAVAEYDAAIRLDPKYFDAVLGRALAYAGRGDYRRAIADYDAAIRLDPGLAAAFDNRGDAYAEQRDYDRAIADYDAAIRLNPREPIYFYNRADTYRQTGEHARAIADYRAALALAPDDETKGEIDTALKHLEAAR